MLLLRCRTVDLSLSLVIRQLASNVQLSDLALAVDCKLCQTDDRTWLVSIALLWCHTLNSMPGVSPDFT